MNHNINDDNEIRQPDPVEICRLIDGNFYTENTIFNNDFDLNTALELSKNEYNLLQEREEEKTIELICEQTKEDRQNKFNNIKTQIHKIMPFDRANVKCYELVLSIIELYELTIINKYRTNENEHEEIFKVLQYIRLPTEEIDNLKKIILIE